MSHGMRVQKDIYCELANGSEVYFPWERKYMRPLGRPSLRWKDKMEWDAERIKSTRNWLENVGNVDRKSWRQICLTEWS